METNKLGVVEFLDKYKVACCNEDVVSCLGGGVVAWLDMNNKDGFNVYFLLAHTPLGISS